MARPKVPHCRECYYLDEWVYTDGWVDPPRASYRCKYVDKWITGQEVRTCPAWCPYRNRGMRVARII